MKNKIKLICGDSLETLKTLPSDSVHTVVTSPPYWGLRDYGVDGQIGLEETFESFLEKLVTLFSEVKRVLHPTGTIWINMGDSYNSARSRGSYGDQSKHGYSEHGSDRKQIQMHPKNRIGQPHKLAFALQDAGWILRDEIIWSKTNAMPSSVEDRTTPSHEFVHLLAKKPRYFFDSFAIREPASQGSNNEDLRNKRSVWTIPTEPFPKAHFATMPTSLAIPCILAGTAEKGCCPECLTPWVRVFKKQTKKVDSGNRKRADAPGAVLSPTSLLRTGEMQEKICIGWNASCKCDAGNPIPCTVLDPFSGAGTTGLVAARLQRSYIGLELSPEYLEMSRTRIFEDQPLLNEVEVLG